MATFQLRTPIAFFIFNRPDTTSRVFEAIRLARPEKLLVVADGPRADREGEVDKCRAARAIVELVDWPCDVLTNYAVSNLGCKRRVSSGLDWVFKTVPEAIMLEDDCLPEPSFFRFCEELLERYRDDERVMMISGDNFQFGRRRTAHSYYFSRYAHIWGWASWRRAWQHYDVDMKQWHDIRDGGWLHDLLDNPSSVRHWKGVFDRVAQGKINTWDYQWTFACWLQSGLAVMPNVNLVSNIGFHAGATHTAAENQFSAMSTEPMQFPLDHPSFVIRDRLADDFTHRTHVTEGLGIRLRRKFNKIIVLRRP
jgi:hypothetical protein